MHRQKPARAWSRPWLAMSAAAWLAACQALPLSPFDPAPPPGGWRVVERLGEARYLAPGMAGWEEVAAGSMIPAGSQVTTGIGGRLIVHQAANQLSAGTRSRFILPGWEPGDSVRQTAGWLRYRIDVAPAAAFGIETPFLDLEVADAVVDVTVGDNETEVAVVSGRVRAKTLDERRRIDLHAGYTGYASLQGEGLMVRGPGQELEPVRPIVVPALHPNRRSRAATLDRRSSGAPEAFSGHAVATADQSVPDAVQPLRPAATPAQGTGPALAVDDPAATGRPPAAAVVPTGPNAASAMSDPSAGAAPAQPRLATAETDPAAEIRRRFDALTEGLLDGLLPALPPPPRRDGR